MQSKPDTTTLEKGPEATMPTCDSQTGYLIQAYALCVLATGAGFSPAVPRCTFGTESEKETRLESLSKALLGYLGYDVETHCLKIDLDTKWPSMLFGTFRKAIRPHQPLRMSTRISLGPW